MPISAEQVAPLVALIQEAGYQAQFVPDSGIIRSRMSGFRIAIFYSAPSETAAGSIQFYCGVGLDADGGFGLEQANAANRKYRFAKFYIDKQGDLAVEADFPFFVDRAEAADDLERMIGLWEGSLSFMKEELANAMGKEEARDEEPAVTVPSNRQA